MVTPLWWSQNIHDHLRLGPEDESAGRGSAAGPFPTRENQSAGEPSSQTDTWVSHVPQTHHGVTPVAALGWVWHRGPDVLAALIYHTPVKDIPGQTGPASWFGGNRGGREEAGQVWKGGDFLASQLAEGRTTRPIMSILLSTLRRARFGYYVS